MSQNDQENEVFSTELKILRADFSKILTKHATLLILLIFQKLGQNIYFSRSYDVISIDVKPKIMDFWHFNAYFGHLIHISAHNYWYRTVGNFM